MTKRTQSNPTKRSQKLRPDRPTRFGREKTCSRPTKRTQSQRISDGDGFSFGGLVLLGVAHRPDDLLHVPDLRDAEPEILADLHRLTDADHLVVDQQFQRLVAALEE